MDRPTLLTGPKTYAFAGVAAATALFATTFALFMAAPKSPALPIAGALAHVALFPVVAALRAPRDAKAAGYGWLTVDIVANIMALNGADTNLTSAIRLGGHVAAAIWIIGVTMETRRLPLLGYPLAAWLGIYSFIAPWVPTTAFYPAFILLLAWLAGMSVLVGRFDAAPRLSRATA
ncbi:MAG: hypothetical protein V4510_04615 [bacterium]